MCRNTSSRTSPKLIDAIKKLKKPGKKKIRMAIIVNELLKSHQRTKTKIIIIITMKKIRKMPLMDYDD